MSKQQTAVDWFYNAIEKNTLINLSTLYEQAKAMEKEQIIEAHNNGKFILPPNENGEQYYNETYES
jgi:hypothetical protein